MGGAPRSSSGAKGKATGTTKKPFKTRSRKLGKVISRPSSNTDHIATTTSVKRIKLTKQTVFDSKVTVDQNGPSITTTKGRDFSDVLFMAKHASPAKRLVAVKCLLDITERYKDDSPEKLCHIFEKLLKTTLSLLLDESKEVRARVTTDLLKPILDLHAQGVVSMLPFKTEVISTLKNLISDPNRTNVMIVQGWLYSCSNMFDPLLMNELVVNQVSMSMDEEITSMSMDEVSIGTVWITPPLALALLSRRGDLQLPHRAVGHVGDAWSSLRSQLFFDIVDVITPRFKASPTNFEPWIKLLSSLCLPIASPGRGSPDRSRLDISSVKELIRHQNALLLSRRDCATVPKLRRCSISDKLLKGNCTSLLLSEDIPIGAGFWDRFSKDSSGSSVGYADVYVKQATSILQGCLQIGLTLWDHSYEGQKSGLHVDLHEQCKLTAEDFIKQILSAMAIASHIIDSADESNLNVEPPMKAMLESGDGQGRMTHLLSDVTTLSIMDSDPETWLQLLKQIDRMKIDKNVMKRSTAAKSEIRNRFAGLCSEDSEDAV
eukprot:GHVH01004759.1.p1 GENE.GHVH01004759.1~~GHVH01004759.1.p1  ORF type:complete len:553 (-),score=71.14 GHVH01004759.1:470-2107(-)